MEIDKAIAVDPKRQQLLDQIGQLFTQTASGRTQSLIGTAPRESALQNEFAALEDQLRTLANQSTITKEQLDAVIAKRNAFGKNAFEGGNMVSRLLNTGRLAFGDEVAAVDEIIKRLQQLPASTDTSAQQSQLERLEAVLKADPATQFGDTAKAMEFAAKDSERVAAAWERAATASMNVGGSPQEPRFYSQISAMGTQPAAVGTSSVTNNNSTTNFNGVTLTGREAAKARQLAQEINRAQRMGTARIKMYGR